MRTYNMIYYNNHTVYLAPTHEVSKANVVDMLRKYGAEVFDDEFNPDCIHVVGLQDNVIDSIDGIAAYETGFRSRT